MMAKLSDETKTLLRKAVVRAKEIPQGFDMGTWAFGKSDAPCGTAGCLAFEICVIGGHSPKDLNESMDTDWVFIPNTAMKVLNLDGNYVDFPLFFIEVWPPDLETAYGKSPRYSLERVLVLEQAVERWIAGDGKFTEPTAEV